ncbi:MAG: 1-acyl-sn-glycerol-3-phosphate acyltransferase [Deltaproteobacteria bacterium]|nr:1-acyl-sn-glycerol-3-phosphate acyltransferase [Deltaproteobacteria bacterium]
MPSKKFVTTGFYRTEKQTVPFPVQIWPTPFFYARVYGVVRRASALARAGRYKDPEWAASSGSIVDALESVGGTVSVDNLFAFRNAGGPCVVVANHMSTLETFLLAFFLCPFGPVTFVVKEALLDYPLFGPVMRSRDPIVVGRQNPRHDLQAVLEDGCDRLSQGISVIVFPQTTRSAVFDPARFNSIGVKLARKGSVPVVPLALKTDAWGTGRLIKDFGPIRPEIPTMFEFADPMPIKGPGKEEQARIVEFIATRLAVWLNAQS